MIIQRDGPRMKRNSAQRPSSGAPISGKLEGALLVQDDVHARRSLRHAATMHAVTRFVQPDGAQRDDPIMGRRAYDGVVSGAPDLSVTIRRGTADDAESCHELLWEAATDLGNRHGTPLEGTAEDWWLTLEPLHRFLAREAAEWWVAEAEQGRIIGYSRSIERGSFFELTELFVRPGEQSRGLGKTLIEHAFPAGRGEVRLVIATTDARALARYHSAGAVARFPMFTLVGQPKAAEPRRLTPIAVNGDSAQLAEIGAIEGAVLGQARTTAELEWLSATREAYLYRRGIRIVGFAFVGVAGAGPIAAADPVDLADILLHVEGRAKDLGLEKLELEVPGPNAVALGHLSQRGFRLDPWINLMMSNKQFGQFDRFIGFSPPIIL